ncbi:hypothetical protein R1sor_010819 [Riccia sorocarpa]|uniref:Uncharacterized protein n=1 Tax=Riccia sorocarpa TaxID=122646 RepID=A0ABD3HZG1_9MARC
MEVDVSPDITKNPDTSGSEFLIVPRRAGASMHLPWAQPMEEDVRPKITALSVPLGTDRAQDRNCTPDDIGLILKADEDNWNRATTIVRNFELLSGAKLNVAKSLVVPIGFTDPREKIIDMQEKGS